MHSIITKYLLSSFFFSITALLHRSLSMHSRGAGSHWVHQWKMLVNPAISKQAMELIFSVKNNKPVQPGLSVNVIPVARKPFTKHLGLYLDGRLSFVNHVGEFIIKAKKGICFENYL